MKKLRQGRRVPRNLYIQEGPTPADTDPPVGMVDTAELAARIVETVNGAERIRELHKPVTERRQIHTHTFCGHCRQEGAYGYAEPVEWPCPTMQALEDT